MLAAVLDAANARDWPALEGVRARHAVIDERPFGDPLLEGPSAFVGFHRTAARAGAHHELEVLDERRDLVLARLVSAGTLSGEEIDWRIDTEQVARCAGGRLGQSVLRSCWRLFADAASA